MVLAAEPVSLHLSSAPTPGYSIVVAPEVVDGATLYLARHPALLGVLAQGTTPGEALAELDAVLREYLVDMEAAGVAVPPMEADPQTQILAPAAPSPLAVEPFRIEWRVTAP